MELPAPSAARLSIMGPAFRQVAESPSVDMAAPAAKHE